MTLSPTAPAVSCSSDGLRPPSITRYIQEELSPAVLARAVLIIEDEVVIAWTLETMLEDIGFRRIAVTASGHEAIEIATREAPALIISDINLGESRMDGVAAATVIAQQHGADVVFVSGFASPEAKERIKRDLPSALLLRKPIAEFELRQAITALTGARPG